MIDRYSIAFTSKQLKDLARVKETGEFAEPLYNAAPTFRLPVLTMDKPDSLSFFIWGLMARWSNNKAMSAKLFNVALDQILEKKSYSSALKNRRCLIPMSGFFLWKPIGKKKHVPYYFHLENAGLLYAAGIWEEADEFAEDSTPNFMLITVPTTENYKDYQENLPLLLTDEQAKAWLDKGIEKDALSERLENPVIPDLNMHPVSPAIADKSKNSRDMIEPAKPADQFGNYTLFG
jgi:putative SOS response-associated peptidase YedK